MIKCLEDIGLVLEGDELNSNGKELGFCNEEACCIFVMAFPNIFFSLIFT